MKFIFGFFKIGMLFLLLACSEQNSQKRKPNIILILADDLGYDDLGIRNKDLITPNLDQLAFESASFSQFYVNPVCAPSRASLLTGRDFIRTGVLHVHGGKDFIHLGETLLPHAMKLNGYATGMWGKWHSGHSTGYFPWERGFDEAYMADLYRHQQSAGLLNGVAVAHEKWADEVIIDYAISFAEKNKDTPFFAFLPSLTPHTPIRAPEEIIAYYEQKGFSRNMSSLYAMITMMDKQLGRLFEYLKSSGLEENTIIIFLSDNGPQISTGFLTHEEREKRYISNLKGHKGNLWENGIKSPLLFKWKDKIRTGEHLDLTDITDLYPTLVELAGGKYPDNQLPLDGVSLLPVLFENDQKIEKAQYNWAHSGWAARDDKPYSIDGEPAEYAPIDKQTLDWQNQIMSVRIGKYKLMLNPQLVDGMEMMPEKWQLFDIINDPTESNNLAASDLEVFDQLKFKLIEHFESVREEKHSFQPPIFLIENINPPSRIFTKASFWFSGGMLNSALELKNWTLNSRATYHVHVVTTGYYSVEMDIKNLRCKDLHMILEFNDTKFKVPVQQDEKQELQPVFLNGGFYQFNISFHADTLDPCDSFFDSFKSISFHFIGDDFSSNIR